MNTLHTRSFKRGNIKNFYERNLSNSPVWYSSSGFNFIKQNTTETDSNLSHLTKGINPYQKRVTHLEETARSIRTKPYITIQFQSINMPLGFMDEKRSRNGRPVVELTTRDEKSLQWNANNNEYHEKIGKPIKKWIITTRIYRLLQRDR